MESKAMEKSFDFKANEDRIYKKWEDSGFFNPDNLDLPESAPPYAIALPPPNITDKLHLGHSSMLAIEDLMIRYHRMKGFRTLWIPGTDHAAIATQNVVEKRLFQEEKKTRHDLGREKFLEKVWEFVKETQSMILYQTRKMGASLDWSREAFTLDEQRRQAVTGMFVAMYSAGVIYRGERIVNWCPRCSSTLADDEIEYKEQKSPFYTFRYSKDFPIAISTTRPETKLADTAVAVNPKDERYKEFVGKTFEVDFLGVPLKLKVIADRQVDMEFGTGALGVTPAHSYVDWQLALQHSLEIVKVIDEDGRIREGFAQFSGMKAKAAREAIVGQLRERGLMQSEYDIENNLSVCYRCDTAIEPLPSRQWFISVDKKLERLGGKSLKEKAMEAAESGAIEFIPSRFKKRYLDWIENLFDWCISRQIWFGHRIPAWYRYNSKLTDGEYFKNAESTERNKDDEGIETYVGIEPPAGEGWVQDEDSLDTWFSSGMWTFSTLGWPDNFSGGEKSGDLKRFHPTQMLETGYEIITLWVSRMVIMSFFALNEIPFEKVYLHGLILDKKGKKMSKSKGNGIDPLDVIEKFGTDAVRLSLLSGSTPGNDIRMYEEKIEGSRNMVNKLWNIARYILSLEADASEKELFNAENRRHLTPSDEWIVGKMENLIKDVTADLDSYNFSQAGERLREFSWNDLADWYVEASKFAGGKLSANLAQEMLKDLLKLWHPFIPFITEAVWEMMTGQILMVAAWPDSGRYRKLLGAASGKAEGFETVKELISAVRNARAENGIEPSRRIKALVITAQTGLINENAGLIKSLRTSIGELEVVAAADKPENAVYLALPGIEVCLMVQIDKAKEAKRLSKEIDGAKKLLTAVQNKLANAEFIEKAPQNVVDKEREKQNFQYSHLNNF